MNQPTVTINGVLGNPLQFISYCHDCNQEFGNPGFMEDAKREKYRHLDWHKIQHLDTEQHLQ
jgi:hypothetical protein